MPKVSRPGKFRQTAKAASDALATSVPAGTSEPTGQDKVLKHSAKDVDKLRSNKEKVTAHAPESNAKTSTPTATSTPGSSTKSRAPDTSLSRGQRRRQAKREQYLRKENMILSSLQLKKQDEQKKRIDGLDALKEALMDTLKQNSDKSENETAPPLVKVETNKSKQRVMAQELNHMDLVLQHPAFQANPFQAIQEHLKNSLAKQGAQQQSKAKTRIQQEQQAQAKKKEEKKERMKGKKRRKGKFKATRSKAR